MIGNECRYECCCTGCKLDGSRAYLTAWMCFRNDAHPALGDVGDVVRASLSEQMPCNPAVTQRFGEIVRASLRKQMLRYIALQRRVKQARILEEATQAWAHQVVRNTADALRVRKACESLGAVLWHAGADVAEPLQHCAMVHGASEGLLARSVDVARADEDDSYVDQDMYAVDFDYDDIVGCAEDCRGARGLRRAAHGAPRRMCKEKARVAGEQVRATAPSRAKKQKKDARHVRTMRRVHQSNQDV